DAIEQAEEVKAIVEERNELLEEERTTIEVTNEDFNDDASDWKIYQNDEYGVKFQYPPELKNIPLKAGKQERQIVAFTKKDEYNNDEFYIVLLAQNLNLFDQVDYISGGNYTFISEKKLWELTSDVSSLSEEQIQILLDLTPKSLNFPLEV
ncbi:MAG: hypothetical protein IH946_06945, partial [Bacteroidetes bacterium]|nr:hypothetical protein [Bacteroidota bacterium]